MIFLFAFITSLFGSVSVAYNRDRSVGYFTSWIIRFVVYLVVMWLIAYSWFIPFVGRTIFMAIAILFMITTIWEYVRVNSSDDGHQTIPEHINWVLAIITFVILCGSNFASCDVFYADDLYQMVAGQQIDNKVFEHNPVDEENIRDVSKDTAIWKAKRMITQDGRNLGAFYKFDVESMFIQRVNGRLYWCAPLEFGGVWKQNMSNGSTPGFIMVSAVDNNEEPRLVTHKPNGEDYKLKYLIGSSWDIRLQRYLCRKYPSRWLMDYSFEVDEQLKPWQVVTWVEPTKWFKDGKRVLGCIIVDPETGECQEYTVDNIPNWVDRVMPHDLALKYCEWFGLYQTGWRACRGCSPRETDKRPALMEGHDNVWMVYGSDGEPYWFTGFTSFSNTDHSLVGKIYMNCRTGKFFYLPSKIGGSDQQGIVKAVQNALPKMDVDLKVTDPIPYNIYGCADAWVVPVVSSTSDKTKDQNEGGQLLRVAVIDGIKLIPMIGNDKIEALTAFRDKFGGSELEFSPSSANALAEIGGVIQRINQVIVGGNTEIRFLLKESPHTFSCTMRVVDSMSTALELAGSGDDIQLKYQETKERMAPVSWYKVLNQPEVVSPNQKGLLETKRQQKETETTWGKQP